MRNLLTILSALTLNIGVAQFRNLVIAETKTDTEHPRNPSIVVNPEDPLNIVCAAHGNRILTTRDGGTIWLEIPVKSPYGMGGESVINTDIKGNLYFIHESDPTGVGPSDSHWMDRIVSQRSSDKGILWSSGTFTGLDQTKDNLKPWAVTSLKKEFTALTWTRVDQHGSNAADCKSVILFSKSTSKGDKWSEPVVVSQKPGGCLVDDFTTMGAMPYMDGDGRIFVTWSNGGNIYLDRSYDAGETWLRSDINVARQMGGWKLDIPGLDSGNGLPAIAGDNSTGPYKGAVYVVYADQRFGENDTDIWFIKSPNRGDNWSDPSRIGSAVTGKHQFFPSITVDQSTGYIYIVYYERKDHDGNQTDVHLAWSIDGGNHFSDQKISEQPFTPDPSVPLGNHIGITASNGRIIPVWTRTDNGKNSLVVTIINQSDLKKP